MYAFGGTLAGTSRMLMSVADDPQYGSTAVLTRMSQPAPVTLSPTSQPVLQPAPSLPTLQPAPTAGSSCGMAGRCTGYVPASPDTALPAIPATTGLRVPTVAPSGAVMAQDAAQTVRAASGPVSDPSGAPAGFLGYLKLENAVPLLIVAAGVIIVVQAMRESERADRKQAARAERARARAARNAS